MLEDFDQQQVQQFLQNIDEDQLERQLKSLLDDVLTPHLLEIRQRAESSPPRQQVRREYESLPPQRQQQKFDNAVRHLVEVSNEIRQNPKEGADELKRVLRDPHQMEALLLIFNHPDVPDEWAETNKEFVTTNARWILMNLLPEVYTREEALELASVLFPNRDPEKMVGQPPGEDEVRGPGDAPGDPS